MLSASSGHELIRFKNCGFLFLYGLFQTLLIFSGSYFDGTLIIEEEGKGLLEHYGVWSILITDVLILITVSLAHSVFRNTISSIKFKNQSERSKFLKEDIKPLLNFLYLKGNSRFIYFFMVFIGLLAWLNNLYQTTYPEKFYGNDVFDQVDYTYGFLANKLNLFISWVFIYPVAIFTIITLCFQTRLILDLALKHNGLEGSVFHPDKCYGFAMFGWLNICLLVPYLFVFIVMYFLSATHESVYQSLIFPMVILTVVFIVVSFATIKPLVAHASKLELQTYKQINRYLISNDTLTREQRYETYLMRICYATASGSPYAAPLKYGIIGIRIVPAIISLFKFI